LNDVNVDRDSVKRMWLHSLVASPACPYSRVHGYNSVNIHDIRSWLNL